MGFLPPDVQGAVALFRLLAAGLEALPPETKLDGAEAIAKRVISLVLPNPLEAAAADLAVIVLVEAIKHPGPPGVNQGVQSLGKIGAGGAGR